MTDWADGLSPRLRGNRGRIDVGYARWGSIPAPAGEPCSCTAPLRMRRVYPRACGGTFACLFLRTDCMGLSPRLRGNRGDDALGQPSPGSIPAPAGEPPATWLLRVLASVYPRACGGTRYRAMPAASVDGLSPRLRGNRERTQGPELISGSIPAPAGEPGIGHVGGLRSQVYPRACGGTLARRSSYPERRGLSPRLRGNPCVTTTATPQMRSIPAPAGEPGPQGSH